MTGLYYRARSYYQYSYIWKMHEALGGQFIIGKKSHLQVLQQRVGKANCHYKPSSQQLPDGVSGLILEMTLNKRNYLKRTDQFKNVLIYHGMGMDKNWKHRHFPVSRYDFYFASGEKDYLRYKHYSYGFKNIDKRIVKIGHIRSDLIINKKYDIEATLDQLGIKDRSRKNIVYAPTWSRGQGSLLKCFERFCLDIPQEHNLIIRAHPYDMEKYVNVRALIDKHRLQNIYLVDPNEIELIDNLAVADLLIGENSSLMYDWIFFDKPVILVKTGNKDLEKSRWATQKKFQVYSCGYTYNPGESNINQLIDKSLYGHPFSDQIKYVRDRTFYFNDGKANERAMDWVKDQLEKMA
ncbi:CDP-glycerol glycerophosphotransferase family protein [bacterium]|nr:CDP-glycerol glycerophosphotransferase family protein [bacterium]